MSHTLTSLLLANETTNKDPFYSWLADCMGEEGIPPATDLEENFRNGVVLAKLANYFAPQVVPKDKIYDSDQVRIFLDGKRLICRVTFRRSSMPLEPSTGIRTTSCSGGTP